MEKVRKYIGWYGSSVLAGVSVGIAAMAYITVGGLAGAALFGFGLLTVVAMRFPLFTGRAQYVATLRDMEQLGQMLIMNLLGTYMVALVAAGKVDSEVCSSIISSRIETGWLRCGLLAIPCGFIMTAAVRSALDKNWWVLLFGVPTFIVCGFPHCIADSFYMWMSPDWLDFLWPCYPAIVAGNFIGCNLYRITNI